METQLIITNHAKKGDSARVRHHIPRGVYEVKDNSSSSSPNLETIQIVEDKKDLRKRGVPMQSIQCVGNYDLGKTLGHGQFGKVKLAEHVLTGEKVNFQLFSSFLCYTKY